MGENPPVIFCTDGVFPHSVGGMQRHSRLLIEALAKQNVSLIVIHPHQNETIFSEFPSVKEVKLKSIETNKNYLKESFEYSKRVYDILIKHPKHVIYAQGLSVWFKANEFNDRLIVNPHGLEPFQTTGLKNKLISIPFIRIFKKIFNHSKYVVSLGGILTEILEKNTSKSKVVTLPNAVNSSVRVDKIFPNSNEKINCFFVARFAHNKGIDVLLEVIKELNNEGYKNNFNFTLAGKGPLFEESVKKYNFSNISFKGFVDDDELKTLYANSHLFVFPTLYEGMPTVVLEAMSYQLPIIVSDTGATSEQVDESNGYLIKPGSKVELKKSLLSYCSLDSDSKQKLGEASKNRVEQSFTWNKVAVKHIELFNKILTEE